MDDKQLLLDKRYMRMARIWAENSYCKRRQVGALLVKNKMIIPTVTTARHRVLKTFAKTTTTYRNPTFCTLRRTPLPKWREATTAATVLLCT